MQIKSDGFILIVTMTILTVLSLIVMAGFEQAQWVKRSQYYLWLRIKMQDRVWQHLALAEIELPQRALSGKCFMPYSISNDYFFTDNRVWPTTECSYSVADEGIQVMYESIAEDLCAQIKNSSEAGVTFFRITVRSKLKASGQKIKLQSVEAMPFLIKKKPENAAKGINCTENRVYEQGRQSWLLQ